MKKIKILDNVKHRLGIKSLNEMQLEVLERASGGAHDFIIYSPTGSGKTVAFAIPLLEGVDANVQGVQAVVIVPSRELAIQVYNVLHALVDDVKITACYGGHSVDDERRSLAATPAIVVATPGRLLDHVNRHHISLAGVRQLVIDEFDKCLELGFTTEMQRLLKVMTYVRRRVLTSATMLDVIPPFVAMRNVITLNFLDETSAPLSRMKVCSVHSPGNDKLNVLYDLLLTVEPGATIVFMNHRDAAERVYAFLRGKRVSCGLYHGGMEQLEREKAVAMFANGSFRVLITTDLASRGLDIDDVKHIIHYNLPLTMQIYTHRNGRTARVAASGNVYVLLKPGEECPDFITIDEEFSIRPTQQVAHLLEADVVTLHFAAGRKEKISRADIVGFIVANGGLEATRIGRIHLSDHYSLVAVPSAGSIKLISLLNAARIKGRRVRISLAEQRLVM